jgi:hypothetical protein
MFLELGLRMSSGQHCDAGFTCARLGMERVMRNVMPCIAAASLVAASLVGQSAARAAVITNADIVASNGTLDLILFTQSAGGASNVSGSFNADDASTAMPAGNGDASANVSYITSIGELRAFYRLNFPNASGGSDVNEVGIFVDLNETGPTNDISLLKLEILTGFDSFAPANDERNAPAANDIASSRQNATGSNYAGGTLHAELDSTPKTLPLNNQGAGFADHVIFTGFNPFDAAYADDTRILFHWQSTAHDSGGESIFLSGSVSPADVEEAVPEPASGALLVGSLVAGASRRRRRTRATSGR